MSILLAMLTENLRSRLCCTISDGRQPHCGPIPSAKAALRSGVGVLRYSAGNTATRELVELSGRMVKLTRGARVPLLIDRRVDVALAVGADGVHLGAQDIPVAHARRLMGPTAIIGATIRSPADARVAEHDGATYALIESSLIPTRSPGAEAVDLAPLDRIRRATSLPICVPDRRGPEQLRRLAENGVDLISIKAQGETPEDIARMLEPVVELVASHLTIVHVPP